MTYAFQDSQQNTVMIGQNDTVYSGTWSSTGTYLASAHPVVSYGNSQFIALADNVGSVPGSSDWSLLVVIGSAGTVASVPTNEELYDLVSLALRVTCDNGG